MLTYRTSLIYVPALTSSIRADELACSLASTATEEDNSICTVRGAARAFAYVTFHDVLSKKLVTNISMCLLVD